MKKMRWLMVGLVAAAATVAGCDCGVGSGEADGGVPDSRHYGWYIDDSGMVHVLIDGGVVITQDGGEQWLCLPVACLNQPPQQCGNCSDDDGDGQVDYRDPECLGPCDNTEGPGLESGVGGTTGNSCGVDCYFDYGNGPGWDDCVWNHRCDPLSPEAISEPNCAYDPGFVSAHGDRECPAEQSQTCYDRCLPITPNGCDCFGCCTFPQLAGRGPNGGDGFVWIGNLDSDNNSTCTLEKLLDPVACPRCTPTGNCYNECGYCEVCVGKPTLPEDCWTGEYDAGRRDATIPTYDAGGRDVRGVDINRPQPDAGTSSGQCEPGVQPCGQPGQEECPAGFYCITGCCIYIGG
ncbi:MAG: hypothetical protein JXR83_13400 [Deltaproteobacteria bacterium]|nr:hypothetical protein [Deltaproteobacteria bacterium]